MKVYIHTKHFDRFMCFHLPVSLSAIRLPSFNKLELSLK